MCIKNVRAVLGLGSEEACKIEFDAVYSNNSIEKFYVFFNSNGAITLNSGMFERKNGDFTGHPKEGYAKVCNRLSAFEGEKAVKLYNSYNVIAKEWKKAEIELKQKHFYTELGDLITKLMKEKTHLRLDLDKLEDEFELKEAEELSAKLTEIKENYATIVNKYNDVKTKIDAFYIDCSDLSEKYQKELDKIVIDL